MDAQSIEVLTHLDAFYNQALDHILFTAGTVLAFVGGVGTLATTLTTALVQRRDFRNDKRQLEQQIDEQVTNAEKAIAEQVKIQLAEQENRFAEKLESEINRYRDELRVEINRARAAGFHVQALFCESQKRWAEATQSFADAVAYYSKANDGLNLGVATAGLKSHLPSLKKVDFETFLALGASIDKAIKELQKIDNDHRFQNYITEVKKLKEQAENRT